MANIDTLVINGTSYKIGTVVALNAIDDIILANINQPSYITVTANNNNVGTLLVVCDDMRHVTTQIFFTHYTLEGLNNGTLEHIDKEVHQFYRIYNRNTPHLDIPIGSWTKWDTFYYDKESTDSLILQKIEELCPVVWFNGTGKFTVQQVGIAEEGTWEDVVFDYNSKRFVYKKVEESAGGVSSIKYYATWLREDFYNDIETGSAKQGIIFFNAEDNLFYSLNNSETGDFGILNATAFVTKEEHNSLINKVDEKSEYCNILLPPDFFPETVWRPSTQGELRYVLSLFANKITTHDDFVRYCEEVYKKVNMGEKIIPRLELGNERNKIFCLPISYEIPKQTYDRHSADFDENITNAVWQNFRLVFYITLADGYSTYITIKATIVNRQVVGTIEYSN